MQITCYITGISLCSQCGSSKEKKEREEKVTVPVGLTRTNFGAHERRILLPCKWMTSIAWWWLSLPCSQALLEGESRGMRLGSSLAWLIPSLYPVKLAEIVHVLIVAELYRKFQVACWCQPIKNCMLNPCFPQYFKQVPETYCTFSISQSHCISHQSYCWLHQYPSWKQD